jgi:hypothetical protein
VSPESTGCCWTSFAGGSRCRSGEDTHIAHDVVLHLQPVQTQQTSCVPVSTCRGWVCLQTVLHLHEFRPAKRCGSLADDLRTKLARFGPASPATNTCCCCHPVASTCWLQIPACQGALPLPRSQMRSASVILVFTCCRFRPAKARCGSLADDLHTKLARFDFPLNDKDNSGCRYVRK